MSLSSCFYSVSLEFNYSFSVEIEIGDDRGGLLQLISVDFFRDSRMSNRRFLWELIFMVYKISSQQFNFGNYSG